MQSQQGTAGIADDSKYRVDHAVFVDDTKDYDYEKNHRPHPGKKQNLTDSGT
jgi:hypothetical protein